MLRYVRILVPGTGLAACGKSLEEICSTPEIIVMKAQQNATLKVALDIAYLPGRWVLQEVK